MKAIQVICISLAVLFCIVKCVDQGGLNSMATPSNPDANSCLFTITYEVKNRSVVFTVDTFVPDPNNPSCTYQNLYSAPLFYSIPFAAVSLNLTAVPSTPGRYKGTWQWADFRAALGSSCAQVGVFGGRETYGCRFAFSSIYFYVKLILVASADAFDITTTGILFTEYGTTKSVTMHSLPVWIRDYSFPHIIGRIENGCNTWNSQVLLSTPFTVLGTHWLGNQLDLNDYLNGGYLIAIFAHKNGAASTNYRFKQMTTDTVLSQPFDVNAPNNCTSIGINYGGFLPNQSYCSTGCAVSLFAHKGNQVYVITTNGVTTIGNLRG